MIMKAPHSRIVITALRGGAGKTTLSAGMLAALRKRGIKTAPFKKGPDYIDAAWLSSASGQACHNLDSFLMGKETILSSFIRNSSDADIALIEGNRGLFDGMDSIGTHSTAELARLLKAPVVMIMDCDKVTRTAAAMILGCRMLDPDLDLRGVILNRVSGSRHEGILRRTIEDICSLSVIGAVPRMKDFPFPQRNLGLTPPQEHSQMQYALETAAGVAEKYIDLNMIISIASQASEILKLKVSATRRMKTSAVTIGILRDSAFQFYYPENLEALKNRGTKVIDISPLSERGLPDIDLLYIGGGFPETHAESLAENIAFRASLRKAAEKGLPVYAECGGLMYLGDKLSIGGREYPMTGALPVSFAMVDKPQGHGYTDIDVVAENPYFPAGVNIRGHEFHHSKIVSLNERQIRFAFRMNRGTGVDGMRDGLCRKQILASYTHIHALGTPQWADALIIRADEYRKQKTKRTDLDSIKHNMNPGQISRFAAPAIIQQ